MNADPTRAGDAVEIRGAPARLRRARGLPVAFGGPAEPGQWGKLGVTAETVRAYPRSAMRKPGGVRTRGAGGGSGTEGGAVALDLR